MPSEMFLNTKCRTPAEGILRALERKDELQHQTHYCPGCGHGIVHKMWRGLSMSGHPGQDDSDQPGGLLGAGIRVLRRGQRAGAHGRAPAVATAIKRSRPESILISYQATAICRRWNCGDYSCGESRRKYHGHLREQRNLQHDGGQMAPTTPVLQKTATTPFGRSAQNEGYPLHMSEMLATLDAPSTLSELVWETTSRLRRPTRRCAARAGQQVRGLGFSLVEVLAPCPTSSR